MTTATYDSPVTMFRECWQDGRLLYAYEASTLPPFCRDPIPGYLFFFGADIGDFKSGQLVGDVEAIPERWRGSELKARTDDDSR